MDDNVSVTQDEIDVANPRGYLAVRLRDVIQRRWSADVRAIGVHGSLAHGDDTDGSDVNLVVVSYRPNAGPRPALRRVDGILVDLTVITADEGLRRARELTPRWPLVADRYLTTRALFDPHGWFGTQRDAHLGRLARDPAGRVHRPGPAQLVRRLGRARPGGPAGRVVRDGRRPGADRRGPAARRDGRRPAQPHLFPQPRGRGPAHRAGRRRHAGTGRACSRSQAEDLTARGKPVDGEI